MTVERGAASSLTAAQELALNEAEFAVLSIGQSNSAKHDYIWRIKRPDEIVGDTLTAQADVLAGWVVDTFAALAEALEPSDGRV